MKTKSRLLACLLTVVLCMTVFSVTAFAGGGEDSGTVAPDTEETKSTAALTPEGNLTLIDDILQIVLSEESDEESLLENKQFITVQSKAGNYFYIIIDRSADAENVYFLNLVDEADLLSLIEADDTAYACACTDKCVVGSINTSCPICQYNMSECMGKETVIETTPEPETESVTDTAPEQSGNNVMLLVLVVLILVGGGAVYYVKLRKKKPDTRGAVDLDDYDYGEDETEYEVEEIPETDEDVPEDNTP